MSKKVMLIALTAISAALFLPAAIASAQEIHAEPGNQAFSIAGGASSLIASGEPTYTCEAIDGSGTQTNSTTGTLTFDITGCHINMLGFTVKCRTAGSALDNTIATGGTYHLITWKNASGTAFPAMLITMNTTTVFCSGATWYLTGDVIGRITSPACGAASKPMTLSFTATSGVQDHIAYTGLNYDLKTSTSSTHNPEVTAAFQAEFTTTAAANNTLNCT